MKYLNNFDYNGNEIQNVRAQNVATDPVAGLVSGLFWINTASKLFKHYDGTAVQNLTNVLESITGSGAISVGAIAGKAQAISVAAASGAVPGTMASADFTKLANAASINTFSTLVMRDASGNFAATLITANLTGTASNASALNSQAASYYLARANATGTQLAATVSDLAVTVKAYKLNEFAVPIAAVAMNAQLLTGLANPVSPQDAATKYYVDALATGLDVKASCRVASTANIAGTYTATAGASARGQFTIMPNIIDGVTLVNGNRVLVKNQTVPAQNGIYVVTTVGTGATGIWDRGTGCDTDAEVTSGLFTFIEEGTTNAAEGWMLSTPNPIVIGGASGTSLTFVQFSSAGAYTASNGILLTGNNLTAVTANAARIAVGAGGIDISATYVGQSTITTVGTITTGVWSATDVAVAAGGTGASDAVTARVNLGAVGKYAVTFGDGAATSYTITHNLNSLDVQVALYEVAGGAEVYANIVHATVNTVTAAFSVAPATNTLRCVVVG